MASMGLLLQAPSQAAVKMSVRAGVSSEGSNGDGSTSKFTGLQAEFRSFRLLDSGPQFLLFVGQRLPSVPCHVGVSTGQVATWQLASSKLYRVMGK